MEFVLKPFKREITVSRLANIHYFEFTTSFHTVNDSHKFCELVYVDTGSVTVRSERYSGTLKKNEMIIHGSDQSHSLVCEKDIAPNIIIIGFECNSKKLDELTVSPLLLSDELQRMLGEIIKEARTVYLPPYNIPNQKNMKKRKDFLFGADQLIKNYLQIFLIKCLRAKEANADSGAARDDSLSNASPLMIEVKNYLDENFRQKITLPELCFLFSTNKTQLSREFKASFGSTVVDYINTLRIDYTKHALREGNKTLTQISEELNISSVHYLTVLFKKYTGSTPTDYLNSIKNILNM